MRWETLPCCDGVISLPPVCGRSEGRCPPDHTRGPGPLHLGQVIKRDRSAATGGDWSRGN